MSCIHMMEYNSSIKRNEVPVCATAWMNLKIRLARETNYKSPYIMWKST